MSMKLAARGLTHSGRCNQLRYLSHSARLQETLPSHMARVTIVMIKYHGLCLYRLVRFCQYQLSCARAR